jgi:hypothetical protein
MISTGQFLEKLATCRKDKASYYDYSKTVYTGNDNKIVITCPIHGDFQQRAGDHKRGHGCRVCGKEVAKITNLNKYGTENPASSSVIKNKIKNRFIEKYGVDNPSKDPIIKQRKKETSLANYGVDTPTKSPEIMKKIMETNMKKYGKPFAIQNKEIAKKATESKILKGGFSKANSSKAATNYIKNYIKEKNYDIDQCAYTDEALNLHEWGIYHNGKWVLYDLVVFEKGYRGDKTKIVEILEYHGPFHYTQEEVISRGDERAFPWKSNRTTIKESYERDLEKEKLGKSLTLNYTIVWDR